MPVIAAFTDHPSRPYVRVQANWADVPSVEFASVMRYDTVTGLCTPLRPYICYDGDALLLSCGVGTWWDTEVPLDHPVYYVTEGIDAPCLPPTPLLYDTFTRTSASTWTTPDIGAAYAIIGGVAANYTVGSGVGSIAITATASDRISWADVGTPNQDATVTVSGFATPTGGSFDVGLALRVTDANNYYLARVQVSSAGVITTSIFKRVAGVLTQVGSTATPANMTDPTQRFSIRGVVNGTTLQVRSWSPLATTEPTTWDLTVTDTSLATGNGAGAYTRRQAGNLTPTSASFDNLTVGAPCVPCAPVTATSNTVTIASDGRFWLKDPVRPCHDRPVVLCAAPAPTIPCSGSGILFIGMGAEVYGANSFSMRPANRRRSISSTRPRGDATTSLRLQTLSFTDRNELLELLAPGSPLLWQGPPEYGIPDRYMNIGDVPVSPELPDLRIQIRTEVLPYDTEDRPVGPTQGICGARVADICALYPTWGDLAATGLTWNDLIAGQASPESANPNRRTWNDVNAEFADWNAVNTGGRTWNGLEEGL